MSPDDAKPPVPATNRWLARPATSLLHTPAPHRGLAMIRLEIQVMAAGVMLANMLANVAAARVYSALTIAIFSSGLERPPVRIPKTTSCASKTQKWRFTTAGTHRGNLYGIAPGGRPVGVAVVQMLKFSDGKGLESWTFADELGFLLRIGRPDLLLGAKRS